MKRLVVVVAVVFFGCCQFHCGDDSSRGLSEDATNGIEGVPLGLCASPREPEEAFFTKQIKLPILWPEWCEEIHDVGMDGQVSERVRYRFDGLGRPIAKIIVSSWLGETYVSQQYCYDDQERRLVWASDFIVVSDNGVLPIDGKPNGTREYVFDKDGNTVKESHDVNGDGVVDRVVTRVYAFGVMALRLLQEEVDVESGERLRLTRKTEYVYNPWTAKAREVFITVRQEAQVESGEWVELHFHRNRDDYVYNEDGELEKVTTTRLSSRHSRVIHEVRYQYQGGRVVEIESRRVGLDGTLGWVDKIEQFSYNPDGSIAKEQTIKRPTEDSEGRWLNLYVYDEQGRLIQKDQITSSGPDDSGAPGTEMIERITYRYDCSETQE